MGAGGLGRLPPPNGAQDERDQYLHPLGNKDCNHAPCQDREAVATRADHGQAGGEPESQTVRDQDGYLKPEHVLV
jgi:hypothetical protein